MSQSVALLVGGTKVLERALQAALPDARHVTAATMEEATGTLRGPDVRLLVIGPTMRRGLQAVSALRAGGSTEPSILVVYRDDQQSEVRRHQKGAAVADRYLPQSRIGQELGEAAAALWQVEAAEPQRATAELEELTSDSIEEVEAIEDEASLDTEALSEEEPPPVEEVLGEFDAGAFEQDQDRAAETHEEAVEILEDAQFEEVIEGEEIELADDAIELEATAPRQDGALQDDAETLDASEWMEETDLATEPMQGAAEVVEELLDAEPIEELLDVEAVEETTVAEELDAADLQEEVQVETLQAGAVQIVTALMPTPAIAPAEPALAPQPTFTAPRAPQKTASYRAANVEGRPSSEHAGGEPEPRRQVSGAQVADDLSGIVGRLQEMSGLIARLEQENETLRTAHRTFKPRIRATRLQVIASTVPAFGRFAAIAVLG